MTPYEKGTIIVPILQNFRNFRNLNKFPEVMYVMAEHTFEPK